MPTSAWTACTTAGRTVTAAGQIATHSARGQCVKPVPSPATLQETKRPAPIRHRQTYTWRVRVRNGPQDRFPRVGTYSCCTSVAHSWHTLNSADVVGSALMSLLLHRMNRHAGCHCELGYSCTKAGGYTYDQVAGLATKGTLLRLLPFPAFVLFLRFLRSRAAPSTVLSPSASLRGCLCPTLLRVSRAGVCTWAGKMAPSLLTRIVAELCFACR